MIKNSLQFIVINNLLGAVTTAHFMSVLTGTYFKEVLMNSKAKNPDTGIATKGTHGIHKRHKVNQSADRIAY